jgi:16S rRNA (cytosine1402-N4)-methyltransferase
MSTSEPAHVPVMRDRVLSLLTPGPGEVALDATLGLGGHAAAILPHLGAGGHLIGLDLDPANLERARSHLAPLAEQHGVTLSLQHANFRHAPAILDQLALPGVDVLLADLGFASPQMDDAARGLSFTQPGPLDMRLDPEGPTTAADLVNNLPQQELADLIYQYGEERLSRKIARKIVEKRADTPIKTTDALAHLVRQAYGPAGRKSRIDPATRTFQALRIAVNGELEALDSLLEALPRLLKPNGRAAIISFHSLEDRRVKHKLLALAQQDLGERLTRKPMMADEAEVATNPRSRSAKLRAFRRAGQVSAQ